MNILPPPNQRFRAVDCGVGFLSVALDAPSGEPMLALTYFTSTPKPGLLAESRHTASVCPTKKEALKAQDGEDAAWQI